MLEFSCWIEVPSPPAAYRRCWTTGAGAARRAAHPSDDHFLPLFFALGAGGFGEPGVKASYLSREVMYSMLAMDSFFAWLH